VLRNRLAETWHGREQDLRAAGEDVSRDWIAGWAVGDPDRASAFVGEAAGLIDAIEPAGVIIERMSSQAARLLGRR